MESALLTAVRNQLRTVCSFSNQECQIEPDEMAPGITGHRFIAVMPNGWRRGDTAESSGSARDKIYSVQVTLIMRVTHLARDRQNDNLFLKAATGMEELLDSISAAIDWQYAVIDAANTIVTAAGGSNAARGFCEPLRESAIDPKPRFVDSGIFAATAQPGSALARTITFDGARRIIYR
jgi:hypothetical protein